MINLLQTIKKYCSKNRKKNIRCILRIMSNSYSGAFLQNGWKALTTFAKQTSSQTFDKVLNTPLKISFFKARKWYHHNENVRCLPILILHFNFTQYNCISLSELHTLRACFFQKEYANQYSNCSWISEHTTNLTKALAGRFLEHILTKKRWNL